MFYFLALLPGVFWGILPPVAKKIGGTPSQQTTGISINLMLLGIVFLVIDLSMGIDYFVGHGTMFLIVFCSGIFWFFGNFFQLSAIKLSSVIKTMPSNITGQILITSSISGMTFHWLSNPSYQIPLGIFFLCLMSFGVVLTSLGKKEKKKKKNSSFLFYFFNFLSIIFYSSYALLPEFTLKLISNESWMNFFDAGCLFPQSLGIFLTCIIFTSIISFKKNKNIKQLPLCNQKSYFNIITGCFQSIANLIFLVVIANLGAVIASPFSSLSAIFVSFILGYVWLKEKKEKKYLFFSIIGLMIIFLSVMFLFLVTSIFF